LRERKGDLLVLADAFLQDIGRSLVRPPAALTEEAKAALLAHDWPGNVRELRKRSSGRRSSAKVAPSPPHLSLCSPRPATLPSTTDLGTLERQMIEQVMRETRWNHVMAAKRLELSRTQL
jgi:transcriptional regulator with GAF, ATPase, and Fis domain